MRTFLTLIGAVFLAASLASIARCGEPLSAKGIELFRQRDQWLYERGLSNEPSFSRRTMKTPIADAINAAQGEVERVHADLNTVLKRLEKIDGKPGWAKIAQNYREKSKSLEKTLNEKRLRLEKLEAKLPDEQKQQVEFEAEQDAAERKWTAERNDRIRQQVLALRTDLTLMPPGAGNLYPGHLEVGAIGVLPQWPVVIVGLSNENRLPVSVEGFANAPDADSSTAREIQRLVGMAQSLARGERESPTQLEFLENHVPGGLAVAKKQHNLKVIQVVDDHRLLVSFIGGSYFDWPTFLWHTADAAAYGDDSTLCVNGVVVVAGTARYTSVNGAARKVFVLKSFDAVQLPPYADEPKPEKPAPAKQRKRSAPMLDPDVLEIGAVGLLPQWPVGHYRAGSALRYLSPVDDLMRCTKLIQGGNGGDEHLKLYSDPIGQMKPYIDHFGGIGVAQDECNLRVVQVLDDSRLFVTFTGSAMPESWPLFVLDIGDTSAFADGATLCMCEPVKVIATERYAAVSGMSPIRYVLRPVDAANVPLSADNPSVAGDDSTKSESPRAANTPRSEPEPNSAKVGALSKQARKLQREFGRLTNELKTARSAVKTTEAKVEKMQATKLDIFAESRRDEAVRDLRTKARKRVELAETKVKDKLREFESVRSQLADLGVSLPPLRDAEANNTSDDAFVGFSTTEEDHEKPKRRRRKTKDDARR